MRIGDLNKRIDIEAPSRTPDGMGGFSISYISIDTSVAAAIWPISAAEQIRANSPTMICTHRIRIRFRRVFKASWKLKYGNRYFNIVSIINPGNESRWLDIMVKEAA